MEIKIQIDKYLDENEVIGTLVAEDESDNVVGEIIRYDNETGIAICELYDYAIKK